MGWSRSVTPSSPSRSASSATAGPSATAWRGSVSPSAWSTSATFHAGLSSTAAAPSLLTAWTTATNSTRFDVITATRSPARTPWAVRWRANELARPSTSRNDQRLSPARTASRSPKLSAARSSPPCMRVDTETLFSADEIDVNTDRVQCSRAGRGQHGSGPGRDDLVHHLALEGDRVASGGVERGEQAAGRVHLFVGGAEGLRGQGDLGRVDAELARVAEGAGFAGFGAEPVAVAEVDRDHVERGDAGQAGGHRHVGAGPGDLGVARRADAAQVGDVVLGAE